MRLHELNEGLDANQKRVGQVAGEESAKDIGPVLGKEQKQHPFKGRLVGEQSVEEGVAETVPMNDAIKVLRHYGAEHFKTTSNELHFYKNGQPMSVDLIWGDGGERSVSLSQLNSVSRQLKGQGVAEAEKNPHTSALGKALYRDLSKEKKASPQQVQRNKERWAKRQADMVGDPAPQHYRDELAKDAAEYRKKQSVAEGYKEERLKGCKCQQRQGDNKKCPIHGVQEGVAEGKEDLASLRAKAKEISDKIDAIVKDGGRVGLDDPLSRRLKAIRAKIQQAKKQGVAEARDGDVNFGHTVTRGAWVVYNGNKVKRFKTHTGAKAYAEKNGGKVASSEFYYDKIQKQGVAEGSLNEFAPDADGGDEDANLHKYARMWYNGDLATQQQVEQILDRMGWEIGELESEEGGAFVVRSGDENGNSYIGFAADDLTEDSNEKIADRYSQDEWDDKMQRLKKLAGMGELKTVWDPVKRVYKNVPVNQEKK